MAEIDGGGLHFKSTMDNDQLNTAIDETMRRIQGFSDGTVAGGKAMDNAFNSTADNIRKALSDIGTAIGTHETELQRLESEYETLGEKAGAAFMSGRDDECRAIKQQQTAIEGEITVRESLIKELQEQSNKLEETASKMEENKRKAEENANAQVSMRTRIRELREEMMLLIDQGIDEQSESYQRLKNELGRLKDIQMDVQQQARTLANDEAKFQGIITGLSGLSGGLSAATGAVSLFAGENENLQMVMARVQSVMAITIGLQQVAQTLNKDSAFQLVTINGLKEWWTNVVAKATAAETAETVATTANTAAKTANTAANTSNTASKVANAAATTTQAAAATAGTAANIGLAGAFRLVGTAIKSIPVFGWILAGISALIGLFRLISKEVREAKKEQKEFAKELVEGTYKPIGSIKQLSQQWTALGDNLEAKRKFVVDNKKAFDELGVAVRDVADAENLLITNKDKFIEAQIAKAKAAALINSETYQTKLKETTEAEQKRDNMPRYKWNWNYTQQVETKAYKKQVEIAKQGNKELTAIWDEHIKYTDQYNNTMAEIGANGVKKYAKGTIGALEQLITSEKEKLEELKGNNKAYREKSEYISKLEAQLNAAKGIKTTKTTGSSGTNKDPFLEKLEKYKQEYTRFNKWLNSGDATIAKAAKTEFDGLLKEGTSYIDYLKKQRDIILSVDVANRTKAQNKQLQMLNDQIAEETKQTVLEAFNKELSDQLSNAKTTLEILNVIEQKRKELANDGTELDNDKKEVLDDAEKDALKDMQSEWLNVEKEYADYLESKIKADVRYYNERKRLEELLADETDENKKKVIVQEIQILDVNENMRQEKNYDALVKDYKNYQQRIADITADYDAKIALAKKNNNLELIAELEKAKKNALSDEAFKELENSTTYKDLFGNLDKLTVAKMIELRNTLETEWQKLNLSPEQLEALRKKIEEVNSTIQSRNPFKALADAIGRYNKASDDTSKKAALKDGFDAAGASLNLVKGGLDAVIGGLEDIGVVNDDITQQLLGDISSMVGGAADLAMGIASGNPLQIIQGSISLITSALKVFNVQDRKAERQIREHNEKVKQLEKSYEALERAIGKALGTDRYSSTKQTLQNLQQQQDLMAKNAELERGKKKSDAAKVEEYENARDEAAQKQKDLIEKTRIDLLGTDARSAAEALGNAFIDAFGKGENAAAAFGKKVDDIVANIMRNMLVQQLLEKPLGGIFEKYSKKWYDEQGNFAGFDTVNKDAAAMGAEIKNVATGFAKGMENLPDEIKKYFTGGGTDAASLTGSIKGVSEETASILGGQVNAMRINQLEATAIMRQQLMQLTLIVANTAYLKHIDSKLDKITTTTDPLRSQGLS